MPNPTTLIDGEERVALEGLRLRSLNQVANGNRRMATDEEIKMMHRKMKEAGIHGIVRNRVLRPLAIDPVFDVLSRWLSPAYLSPRRTHPDCTAAIAVDILNKEEVEEDIDAEPHD